MDRPRSTIALAACLSLLAMQMSGLHMHVDAQGYVGTPQGTHVHGKGTHSHENGTSLHDVDADGHGLGGDNDHAGDKDLSIVDFSAGASGLLIFFVWFGLALIVILRPGNKISPNFAVPRPRARHFRWRPPLRAPPRFSYAPSH